MIFSIEQMEQIIEEIDSKTLVTEKKWWARLQFRLTGYWPKRVVKERIKSLRLVEQAIDEALQNANPRNNNENASG